MNTQTTTSEYMLLFRGAWDKGLSPDEIPKVTDQFKAWADRLSHQGKLKAGHPLGDEARIISGRNVRTVADGPFVESKEAIAGYFVLQVDDLDEAVEIAKECPGLDYGLTVEVRRHYRTREEKWSEQRAHASA